MIFSNMFERTGDWTLCSRLQWSRNWTANGEKWIIGLTSLSPHGGMTDGWGGTNGLSGISLFIKL